MEKFYQSQFFLELWKLAKGLQQSEESIYSTTTTE